LTERKKHGLGKNSLLITSGSDTRTRVGNSTKEREGIKEKVLKERQRGGGGRREPLGRGRDGGS